MSRRWRSRLQVSVTMTVALVLAAAVMLAACGGCGTTAATFPGTAASSPAATSQNAMPLPAPTVAGTLAFARVTTREDDGYVVRTGDICAVRTDGTELTPLAADGADESQPAWSPDGRQIAYATIRPDDSMNSTVRVMNADGSGKRRLWSALASWSPAWSPDGTQIAFAEREWYTGGWAGSALGLAVVNADGSGLRELTLTSDPHVGDQYPAWSPDGRIVFLRARIGDVLWVNSDGSGLTRVTTGGGHAAFALSPDGKQLAIYDQEHDHLVLLPASGDGTPVVLVDNMSQYVPSLSVRLAWSPDGTALAFAASSDRARMRMPYPPGSALYVVNADGSGLSVVPNTGKVWDPAWRPE